MKRPVMRYHGGKYTLAKWIISYFPAHKIYVEPFGGAASILMNKPRSQFEVYAEIDREITGLFEILRDKEQAQKLEDLLRLTPFSRAELATCFMPTEDRLEQARRTLAKSFLGFSTDSVTSPYNTGFRGMGIVHGKHRAKEWLGYADIICEFVDRLQGVIIENGSAIDTMRRYDSNETLFYLDPPYVRCSRFNKNVSAYRFEMTDEEHCQLLDAAINVQGMVIISGFETDLYNDRLKGWTIVRRNSKGQAYRGSKTNIECLWLSPNIKQNNLFMEGV